MFPKATEDYMRANGLLAEAPTGEAEDVPTSTEDWSTNLPMQGAVDPPAQDPSTLAMDCVEPGDYIEPDSLWYFYNAWIQIARPLVLLSGPRGTGKSLAVRVWCARHGFKLIVVECEPEMQAEQLLGAARIRAGTDYWQDGPLVMAARLEKLGFKVLVFLDEFNLLPEATQAKLNGITDGIGQGMTLAYTGERVHWTSPRIVCAFNEGYAGTRSIQQALRDRARTLETGYLPAADEINLLVGRTGLTQPVAEQAVKCANSIRAAAATNGDNVMPLDFDFSFRALLDFGESVAVGQAVEDAWREAVLGRVGNSYREEATRGVVVQLSKTAGMLNDN